MRLGFPHSIGTHYAPRVIARFRDLAPTVEFELVQARVRELVKLLLDGELDLALVTPWEAVSRSIGLAWRKDDIRSGSAKRFTDFWQSGEWP